MTATANISNPKIVDAINRLPAIIAVRANAKKTYDNTNSRIAEMRSHGREVGVAVLQSQQKLYDAWRELDREINGVLTTLVPAVRKAAADRRLSQSDLEQLAQVGIIPRVNGVPTIPGGWGLQGLGEPITIGVTVVIAAAAVIAVYIISEKIVDGVERSKIAAAKANAIAAENVASIAAQNKQWAAQIDAETKAAQIELDAAQKAADKAVSEGKPIPPVLFNAAEKFNALKSIPQSPTSLATAGDGKGNLMGTLVKGGLAVALVVGGIWAFGQRRSKA